MKRKATDETFEAPDKRLMAAMAENTSTAEESSSQISHDDSSTIQPSADAQTPATIVTDASTTASGRRKFPSQHKTIPCTIAGCTKKFNRPARLVAHMRSHNNERPYKCTYEGCDKAYSDNKHLKVHIVSAHTKETKFVCPQCDKGFATSQRLKAHALAHQGKERFRCRGYPPCDQSFRKHQTLQRHVLKDHLGQKPYPCTHEGCTESYDTANSLKAHVTREHGELRFWCDECSQAAAGDGDEKKPVGFTTQFLLERHIRSEHVNCIFCDGMKFNGQYLLEQHMEIYHSGLTVKDRKTVPCDFDGCDKSFTKKSNMKVHYRAAHEGLRYVCGKLDTSDSLGLQDWNWAEEGCGETFTTKVGLEMHVTYVHLGKQRPLYESPSYAEYDAAPGSHSKMATLDDISGVAEYERRQIPCAVPGCIARFIRYAELSGHMQAAHPDLATFSQPAVPHVSKLDLVAKTGFDGQPGDWDQEDANVMQLLNLDGALDPELFV